MTISRSEYDATIQFSEEVPNENVQLLIEQHEAAMKAAKRKKKKK